MNSDYDIPFEMLSKKETEVLSGLANGLQRNQIALRMHISLHTYDSYRKSIRQKFRIKSTMDWGRILIEFQNKIELSHKQNNT